MYFVGVGTHDEDVSLDPVRIYELPEFSKGHDCHQWRNSQTLQFSLGPE